MSATETLPLLTGMLSQPASPQPWLDALRSDARRAFDAEGVPGRRTEAWKYTRLTQLTDKVFLPGDFADVPAALPEGLNDLDAFRVALVNGRYAPGLSDLGGLPEGVWVTGLATALADTPGRVQPWLGGALHLAKMPLAALNTVGFKDGVLIHVPDGVVLDRPIHIVCWTDGTVQSVASSPRMVFSVGEGASAEVVESHAGRGGYFVNAVAEVFLAPNGRLGHFKRQEESDDAFHIAATAVNVAEGGQYDSFVLQTGSSLARNEIRTLLDGEEAGCRLNGAYAASGTQHLDNTTFIDHAAPDCASREVYKGVLADTARGVFQGKILVRRGAQRIDGHQLNRALLLSRGAEVYSKPELEIYADDVKCSHGATAGELDQAQLFYLRARGIGETAARRILVEAFLMEVLDEIDNDAVRQAFAGTLARKLVALAAAAEERIEA